MKTALSRTYRLIIDILVTPPNTLIQFLIILVVSLLFILMPQKAPIDWVINTRGFWSNIPQTYVFNQNFVYPPWGLILLLPYYFIHAEGARVLSVLTIGWLTHFRKWPFSLFFAIVLSPYFLRTMAKSNMDILVIIFPILIWEWSKGKKVENIARGISLAMLLLKPQCTLILVTYLLWRNHKEWKKVMLQLGVGALIIVPISLYGSPLLFFQWLNNIVIHPSSQNQFYWSINNISLTAKFGFLIALGIIFLAILTYYLLLKSKIITWKKDHTTGTLLLFSMYLSPYTSQQSFSSGLAFIPSWVGFFIQYLSIGLGILLFRNYDNKPLYSFIVAFLSLLLFSLHNRGRIIKDSLSIEIPFIPPNKPNEN
jgi:hypothetical protein